MQGIYKLEFKDGSVYIGQSQDIRNRWSQHLREMETNKHVNKLIQSKFDEFGFPSLEVLKYTEDDSDLDLLEAEFIKQYTTDSNKLNIRPPNNPRPNLTQLSEIKQLKEQVTLLEGQIKEVLEFKWLNEGEIARTLKWAERKMREEAKERERRESEDDTPRLVLGRKPVK